ncbi:MAG: sigma-70 family RNA polymerase sigma factor [Planctomycetes bacterium]|nr:sigma-70 family RNA polymerase sigma factor [Planctomycetota bacterium]
MAVDNEFATTLARFQHRIYAYALMLTGEPGAAEEVVQQVNVVLCAKADDFVRGTDFMAWAAATVRFEVKAFRTKQSRDRHVFDAATFDILAAEADANLSGLDETTAALHQCIERLSDRQRAILRRRYFDNEVVAHIADAMSMTANAVDQSLFRIRKALAKCVEARLNGGRS